MNQDLVKPVVVLTCICLFISGILAAGNAVMNPIIQQGAADRANAARMEIMPQAENFIPLEADGLPKTITAAYGTSNNIGYIFMITTQGYGGDVFLICGIDPEGKIIKTMTLSHTETKGISDPVFELEPNYTGKDASLEGIEAVSGATISSKAYMNGIRDAFIAFETVKEVH